MDSLIIHPVDDSVGEVALKLVIMHEECLEGNFMSIQQLRETNQPSGAVPPTRQIIRILSSGLVLGVDTDGDDDGSVGIGDSSEMILDAPVFLSRGHDG